MNFDEWLCSEEGKSCADFSTLTTADFLRNRLWWAFNAGMKHSEFANSEHAEHVEQPVDADEQR